MNKKKIIIIISIVLVIIVAAVVIILVTTKSNSIEKESDQTKIYEEYAELNDITEDGIHYIPVDIKDNKYKYITLKGIKKILNHQKNAVIYLGNSKCPLCRTAVSALNDAANDSDISKIYYYDTSKNYDKLKSTIKEEYFSTNNADYFNEDDKDVPMVLFINSGIIVSYHYGIFSTYKNPFIEIDDKLREELVKVYKSGINETMK